MSAKAFTLPIRTDVFAGLAIVIAALFFMSVGMAQAPDVAAVKLHWQFAACVFGLAAAGLCIPFVPAAVIAVSNGVPAALDLTEGPHIASVSSCWLYQRPVKNSRTNTSTNSNKNEFEMTLSDKSKLVLVVETETREDLQSASGIYGTLYKGCNFRSSSKKLVLDMYPRTRIITDARLV